MDGCDLEFETPGRSCLSCVIVQLCEICFQTSADGCETPAQSCNRKTAPVPTGRTSPQCETCPPTERFGSKQ